MQSSFCTRALVVLEPKGHWSTSTCYRLLAQGRNVASLDKMYTGDPGMPGTDVEM